ncbi:BatD family protein [Puniceibacterium sediminis]|uniref:Oxygen tolerance n=1 Tax=Puniceibacterium sediminis TaxID=1608407 RepID=A0A238YZC3_9RHOB|nr:BatD family protein [Puniceibacterium sediminis]SNR75899.1 Oxygen tolerance [Puniceibacterium sediminis]
MVRILLILFLAATAASAQETDLPTERARLDLVLDDPGAQPMVGRMVLATIRGVYAVNITLEELKLRRMTGVDWVRLGQDNWSQQRIDGRSLRVFERRIALYPKASGSLTILPIAHDLEYLEAGQRRRAIVRSEPVTIEVRAAPVAKGDTWLPARAVELSDSFSADAAQLVDGESVERRVILRVFGATPEMLPPQPAMRAPWLITFSPPEERSQQLTPEGPVTTVIWRWTLRPTTGELGVLPAVTIPWYDTDRDQSQTVTIPAAPIGYKSFADNSASSWSEGFAGGWRILLIWMASGIVSLTLLAAGRGSRRAGVSAARKVLTRWKMRSRLRRDARRDNDADFRKTAVAILRSQQDSSNKPEFLLLRPLDEQVFGKGPTPSRIDLRVLAKTILHRPR